MFMDITINFLHLLATCAWIGGMIFINMVLVPSMGAIAPPERGKLMGAVAKKFPIIVWTSVIVLIITGVLMMLGKEPSEVSDANDTLLHIKLALVLIMISIGVIITLVISPKMKSLAPAPGEPPTPGFLGKQKNIAMLSMLNMVIGIIVLLLVAMMQV